MNRPAPMLTAVEPNETALFMTVAELSRSVCHRPSSPAPDRGISTPTPASQAIASSTAWPSWSPSWATPWTIC